MQALATKPQPQKPQLQPRLCCHFDLRISARPWSSTAQGRHYTEIKRYCREANTCCVCGQAPWSKMLWRGYSSLRVVAIQYCPLTPLTQSCKFHSYQAGSAAWAQASCSNRSRAWRIEPGKAELSHGYFRRPFQLSFSSAYSMTAASSLLDSK